MALVAVVSAFLVAYIAFRGVQGSTNVNLAINAIQITALIFFGTLAIAYRVGHPDGSTGLALDGPPRSCITHLVETHLPMRAPGR
jgi:amino acid transporter